MLIVALYPKFNFGQMYDSAYYPADSNQIKYFRNTLDFQSPAILRRIDTLLVEFEEYDPLFNRELFSASLGNVGLAYNKLLFGYDKPSGFNYQNGTFDAYFSDDSTIDYYRNARPYTEVSYITGAKKEQLFQVKHEQRVFRRLAVGLDLNIINSIGGYQRQKSDHINVIGKMQFFTENLRYGIISNYIHNKIRVRENGGIQYDSIYEFDLEPNRSIIPVNLAEAENLLRKSGVYFQQYFQLSARKTTNSNDSVLLNKKKLQFKFGRLAHSFDYKRYSAIYSDQNPDSNFYPAFYSDSTATYDSVYYQTIENTFSWSNADYPDRIKPMSLLVVFGIKHQLVNVNDTNKRFETSNLIPYARIVISPHPLINISGKASFILNGKDYQGDFDVSGLASLSVLRKKPYKTSFNFEISIFNHEVPYFYQNYFSNHFWWENDFGKIQTFKMSSYIVQRGMKIGLDILKITDYIYVGFDALPVQHNESLEVLKADFAKKQRIGKLDLDGRLVYQKVSNEEVLRLPELMAYLSAAFNLKIFNGALITRAGADVNYFSSYFANAYMPATRSFYLQNEKKIGNNFHVNIFVDFNVKRTRFFLKAQNLLEAFGQHDFYQVPHYPSQDFAIKFGLSWRFHD